VPTDLLDLADRLWRGEVAIEEHHPLAQMGALVELATGVAFIPSFGNVSAFVTNDGLVLVDTGGPMVAAAVHEHVRAWSKDPVHTVIYSHGHIDHVCGVKAFEEAAATPLRVIAHEGVPARFDRYVLTAGYNRVINERQFGVTGLEWPLDYRYPDETYRDRHVLTVGGEPFELNHARGETDDHTWTWVPDRKVLCCGDLFIWACPNAGNPQKVQRYPREWAIALRTMAELGAEIMLPGHGLPVIGAERIAQTLIDSADLLDALHDQVLALMNEGARLDEVIHSVKAPAELIAKPYLRAVYDKPEFIVRNLWRLYGGWFDGNAANLEPAPERELAAELAALAGGADALAARGRALAKAGELRLAGHLVELAALAAPTDRDVHEARAEVFDRRASAEESLMGRGIFSWAAAESRRVVEREAGREHDRPVGG
jgi:alkyl sulfatase BDS1-like metallo-beta-lactamase superfamily hydrolase